jgi:hypothetical protein
MNNDFKIELTDKTEVRYQFLVTFPGETIKRPRWSKTVELGDLHTAQLDVEQQVQSEWKWMQEQAAATAAAKAARDHWNWMQRQPNADEVIKAHFESQGLVESQEVAQQNIEAFAFNIEQDEVEESYYRSREEENWHEEATKDLSPPLTPLEQARKIVESDIRWRLAKKT